MLVRTDLNTVLDACLEDEFGESLELLTPFSIRLLRVLRGLENAEECLYDMISVSALNSVKNYYSYLTKLRVLI